MNDSFLKTQQKIELEWKNLSLIDKKTSKHVLNKLSGKVTSGQFLTIMGPSGAGKSSFLSIITSKLSAYTSSFNIKGKTTLNGSQYSEEEFISIASYVPQDDVLMETLTVQQTLEFQARLKLSNLTQIERKSRVEEVLKMLNLYEIRKSYVGGRQKKSISGGQKKRVVIGVELISNPSILVLDEPTSGLDSFNSLKIIKLLSKLAKQENKLIIATIHQPSTLMFQNFDRLMVLKLGRQVYHDEANRIVEYMENLEIKVDYRMNPADFFMLELSAFKQLQGYETRMTADEWENYQQSRKGSGKLMMINDKVQKIDFTQHPPTPLMEQFQPLLIRNLKNSLRMPSNQFGRLMQMICYPLFIGTIYYDIIDRFNDISFDEMQTYLGQFASFIFIGVFFAMGQTLYDTMLVFPTEKELILKEVHSNMYSMNLYWTTKFLVDIPTMLIPIYIATTVVYFEVGLENSFTTYLLYQLIFTLVSICGYLIGIIAGVLCKHQNFATQVSPFIVMPLVVFGGLVVNLNTLPGYSSWFQYLTPIRYGYNVLTNSQLDTDQMQHLVQYRFIKDKLGLLGTNTDNIIELMLLTFGFFVFSFVILYARKKFQ